MAVGFRQQWLLLAPVELVGVSKPSVNHPLVQNAGIRLKHRQSRLGRAGLTSSCSEELSRQLIASERDSGFRFILFFYVKDALPAGISVHQACAWCPQRLEEGIIGTPGAGVAGVRNQT